MIICQFVSGQGVSNTLLDLGISDYNKGQYSFAINNLRKFTQIVENNDEKPKAYYYISLSYYFLDNYNQALNYINELQTKYRFSSYSVQSHFWKGLIYQNKKDWQEAEDSFVKYISSETSSELTERAYLALANSQFEQAKFKEAENSIKTVIDKYKKSDKYEESSVLYCYLLIKNGKQSEAKQFLTSWINKLGKTGEGYQYKDRFWLYLAQLEIDKKNYDNAKILLKKIDTYSKNSPSSDIALLQLSNIEESQANFKEAKEYLLRLANEYPSSKYNTDAILSFAKEEYRNNNFIDAINLFKQAVITAEAQLKDKNISKEDTTRLGSLKNIALFYMAEIYYKSNNIQLAIDNYKSIYSQGGDFFEESLLKLLEIYINNNKLNEATAIITNNDTTFSKSQYKDRYILIKSKMLYLNGKYNESLTTLDNIADKNSNIVNITNLKVNNFVKLAKLNDAINTLKDGLGYFPLNEKGFLYYNLMNFYFNVGLHKDVIETYPYISTFSKYINDDTKDILKLKSDYLVAISYMELKDYDKSIVILKSLLSIDSKKLNGELLQIYYKSFYYAGWVYYKKSNFIDASKNFGTASLLDITDKNIVKDSYYMEAISNFSRRDYTTALQKFETIYKKFYPDELGIKSYYEMGKCYENLGTKDKAIAIYKKIFYEFPKSEWSIYALYELTVDLFNKKELDEANKLAKLFWDNYPDSNLYKNILLLQAESFLANGRYGEAVSVYNFYLKKYPTDDNLDTIYYWLCYSSYKIKDYETVKEMGDIIVNDYYESSFYNDILAILKEVYNSEKDWEKEKYIVTKLLKVEKDQSSKNILRNRLEELNLILQGTDSDEARLILESEKGGDDAKLKLAIFYYKGRDKDKGVAILKELSEKNSDNPGGVANNILGDIELNNNNYIEAQKIFLKTISGYKSDSETMAEALYKTGYTLYKQGKESQAKKIFERLKTNFANSPWTKKAISLEKRFKE